MPDVIGWEGLILPYSEVSPVGDPRVVLPPRMEQLTDPLPLPAKIQWVSAPGHENAEQGLSLITRVWSGDDGLWASGPIDVDDEEGKGKRFARKLAAGFLGFVSADIKTDGGEVVNTAHGRRPAYKNWLLTGVTLVGDPAFARARIYPVYDPSRITPVDEVRTFPTPQAFAVVEYVTFTTGTKREEKPLSVEDTDTGTTEPVETDADFAVADPGIADVITDEADTSTGDGISDADIARIADAVVARLDDRDTAMAAEFSRIEAARQLLDDQEEATDGVL